MNEFTAGPRDRPADAPSPPQTSLDFAQSSEPAADPPAAGVRLAVDDDGVGWVLFDLPGSPVNILSTPIMETLRDLLDEAVRRNVKGLVFTSDKPEFSAKESLGAEALGRMGPEARSAEAALTKATKDASDPVRQKADWALGRIKQGAP